MRTGPEEKLYIGLMSGTSMDGVDGVLVRFDGGPAEGGLQVLGYAAQPLPDTLKAEFMALNMAGANEIHRAALAGNDLVQVYAEVVAHLLKEAGVAAQQVQAIGAHGQTVRHRPQTFDGPGYTVQINQPALLAERTGIDVVADFRSRDVAAGGQGAPLVPAFHAQVFGQAAAAVAVLNLGGIANVTLIPPRQSPAADAVTGFDTGPANALLDHWCQRHTGQAFDRDGAWAATGQVQPMLLQCLLADPYFALAPPKSTGRDLFNPAWLEARLTPALAPADVQATLAELTVQSAVESIFRGFLRDGERINSSQINSTQGVPVKLLVCGGGAYNGHLMRRLQAAVQAVWPQTPVQSTVAAGLPPLQVEAAAFAWLARQCVLRRPGNLPRVTGAKKGAPEGARVLGAIYPA
ncbi:MAG: hypothetical protein RLZZ126_1802 [Pseudomonadota bacterium]|jgi:anhydro-N-acetylmuramic acid kinase